jgi:hypothetical protein
MRLRLDELLQSLRDRQEEILRAIDADPLLMKKSSGDLVLANASKELFTPQHEHQLFAKGIVYRRAPYRLVSLPLVKIYNLGERQVSLDDLHRLFDEGPTQTRFLRKLDGSLVQAFRHDGRAHFTTRGMIEGATARGGDGGPDFDYLTAVRDLARRKYPALLDAPGLLEGRTLVLELLHPAARIITDYGPRESLVLLAAFDHGGYRYLPHDELLALAAAHGLEVVDALTPAGETLAQQIEDLLAGLAGTDQEGTVLTFERGGRVVYRVKIKSPDYLRLLRAMTTCTYDRTVELLDAHPDFRQNWPAFEAFLKSQGSEVAPEEVLPFYRGYFDTFTAYLADCGRLLEWAFRAKHALKQQVAAASGSEPLSPRKAFAAVATTFPHSGLLFAALDDRLDLTRIRKYAPTQKDLAAVLQACAASWPLTPPPPS